MAKTQKKASVPKRIAGVKVPKSVRRGLKDLASSDAGKTAITQALVAAGAALAAIQARPDSATRRAIREKGPALKATAHDLTDRAADAREALGAALEEATRSFTDALRRRSGETATPKIAEEPAGSTH